MVLRRPSDPRMHGRSEGLRVAPFGEAYSSTIVKACGCRRPGARSVSDPLSITLSRPMPLDEVTQYQSDSGSGKAERQSESMQFGQTYESDDHGSSLDLDGDGDAVQKDFEEMYSFYDSASHTPAQKSKL